MIFIGLDVSKISTALTIENNDITKLYCYSTKKDSNIWVKNTNDFIIYRHINYNYNKEKDYSKSELLKLNEFDNITDLIIKDILDNYNMLDSIRIAIEGFSYNSKGPIFDLIEFTTILKYKLMTKMVTYTSIEIISPMSLKMETCKMIYEPRIEIKGKRVIKEIIHHENDKGKNANNFDKWDMFFAFLKSNINTPLKLWCLEYEENITKNKDLPKPIDDIVDSLFLKEIIKNKYKKP